MDIKQLTKKCSKCGKVKLLDEFSKDKYHKDGKCSRCKKCMTRDRNEYRQKNKKKFLNHQKEYNKKYFIENRDKILKHNREYNGQHKEYLKEYKRIYRKERLKVDLKFKLNANINRNISLSLKGNKKGRRWENLIGYTLNDLIKRLKKTMPKGYTWDDYLEGKLHIDHIIPISVFNFDNANQINFKRCWALSNLQLLPAKENLIKYNKLTKPFQPSLAM